MPGIRDPGATTWLVLVYRLPPKSAPLTAMIRRRLTADGAVYLAHAVAAVPSSGAAERSLRRARHVITDAGGSAVMLRAQSVWGEREMTAAYNDARDREYEGISAACRDAVAAIGAMTAAGDFRDGQLWARDAALKRLAARRRAVGERDVLGAGRAQAAVSAVAAYRAALDEYANRVYARDTGS